MYDFLRKKYTWCRFQYCTGTAVLPSERRTGARRSALSPAQQASTPIKLSSPLAGPLFPDRHDMGLIQHDSRGCGAAGVLWLLLLPRYDSSPHEFIQQQQHEFRRAVSYDGMMA